MHIPYSLAQFSEQTGQKGAVQPVTPRRRGAAVALARASSSGYIARRLRDLCDEFGPLSRDHRLAELGAEIATLSTP